MTRPGAHRLTYI
jgi:hypothetical protein